MVENDEITQSCLSKGCMACAVGGCNVEAADALGGLRSWQHTWERLKDGWPRWGLGFDLPGWRPSAETGIWLGSNDRNAASCAHQ